jgi:hypothetical protein
MLPLLPYSVPRLMFITCLFRSRFFDLRTYASRTKSESLTLHDPPRCRPFSFEDARKIWDPLPHERVLFFFPLLVNNTAVCK